jgi:hypothetical protein
VVGQRARLGLSGVEIVDAPSDEPDPSGASVTVGDDGSVVISMAGPQTPSETIDKSFHANLARRIDQGTLDALASVLLEAIEADDDSRADWLDTANLAAKYLGVKLEEPNASSSDGTVSKHISTAMLEVAVKQWSTGRAELLPVDGPVKIKRDDLPVPTTGVPGMEHNGGPDLPQQPEANRDELANALEQDLNWYLTKGDREYYPDFSKMLMSRALVGTAFRKVFRCPIRRKPVSRWVKAQNLIVSNDASSVEHAGRVTEVIKMRQAVMRRMQAQGHYLDTALSAPTGIATATEEAEAEIEGVAATQSRPQDMEHTLYECVTELDSHVIDGLDLLERDEDGRRPGYPLPYRVTIDKDSRCVLEIRREWKKGDENHQRRQKYVRYGYIPGLNFYDYGLIHIAGNSTLAATMIERSAVDSALYANFPGGLIKGTVGQRNKQTVFRPNPGEFQQVDGADGEKISDIVSPLPYKPPSPEAMALGEHLEQSVRTLGGIIDLPVGEGRIGNTPVGTIMSYVEAVSQVPGAVHKDDHISQSLEFELLRDLIAEEPEVLTRGNRTPARQWQVSEELLAPDLMTSADPNTPSAIHRLMKLQALIQLTGMPQFAPIANMRAIWEMAVRLLVGGSTDEFTNQPQAAAPPPPDPRIVAAQIKAQSQQQSDQAKMQEAGLSHQARMQELAQESAQRDADRQSDETRAAMSLEAARMKTAGDASTAAADRAHQAAQTAQDRQTQAGIAAAGLIQRHTQHLNELGAQQQAQPSANSDQVS